MQRHILDLVKHLWSTFYLAIFCKFHDSSLKGFWINWMFHNSWVNISVLTLSELQVHWCSLGIHSHFFIALPFWLKLRRSKAFFLYTRQNVLASEILNVQVHLIDIGHVIWPSLWYIQGFPLGFDKWGIFWAK